MSHRTDAAYRAGFTDGIAAARTAVLQADAYANAIGEWRGQPLVTAETARHLDALAEVPTPTEAPKGTK